MVTRFCVYCGNEIPLDGKFCSKCGKGQQGSISSPAHAKEVQGHSKWPYLLPIFIGIIGGLIAYFWLRKEDPKTARNCLWLGIIVFIITFVIVLATGFKGQGLLAS